VKACQNNFNKTLSVQVLVLIDCRTTEDIAQYYRLRYHRLQSIWR